MNFFAELKRRHIYRVAAAYAVVAWLLIQLVNNVAPALKLPDWTLTLVIVLLGVGFPIVLIFAWVRDLAPADSAHAQAKTGMFDWALMAALVVVIGLVSYQQLASSSGERAAPVQQAGLASARSASLSPATAISIAVLPFENLSAEPEQEFFAAGMSEEITSALAKIPDLRVVARTSAFQFKGQNRDIQAIAQALHATHLIEGSVRRAGTRLRITAQLINAESGVSIWSENYDREYADVFAIQEDIARAIAGALQMPLGLKPGERLVSNRTSDLKSYEDYLRIRAIGALARTVPNARKILEQAVARDPGFAPAWASLADQYWAAAAVASRQSGSVEEVRQATQSLLDKAEMAARKAIELDSRYASGYGELGTVQSRRGKWTDGEKLFLQALTLDAEDPETLQGYGVMLGAAGYLKEALRVRENLLRLEPFVPIYNFNTALVMRNNGQNASAVAILEAMSPYNVSYNRNYALAMAYAAQGQYAKAADTLLLINAQVPRQAVEDAAKLLRTAPTKVKAPEELPALQAELNFVYAHVGALDRVLEFPERVVKVGSMAGGMTLVWDPLYAPLRKTERFKTLMRNAGLVDYWRARGWPDLCRPMGADDFVCD